MVYGLSEALKNLNIYCQEKTTRIRDSFSPARQSSASSPPSTIPSPPTMPPNDMDDAAIEDPKPMPEGSRGMSRKEFRKYGKETVDYIADYLETIHKRRVVPAIEPGYLQNKIPADAPIRPESWETVMDDFEKLIMPGVTHWQHPRFHAYFPAGNSFPSILANMLGDALGCVGFSWVRYFFINAY